MNGDLGQNRTPPLLGSRDGAPGQEFVAHGDLVEGRLHACWEAGMGIRQGMWPWDLTSGDVASRRCRRAAREYLDRRDAESCRDLVLRCMRARTTIHAPYMKKIRDALPLTRSFSLVASLTDSLEI